MTVTSEWRAAGPERAAARALAFALGAGFLSRAAIGPVVESLRAELWLTDKALGVLLAGYAGAYAAALPAAAALDRGRARPRLLAGALALCAAGTLLSGAAIGFWTLLAARVIAGAGAGASTALALGLLEGGARRGRGRSAALLLIVPPIGLAAGYLIAGALGSWPGWRLAFCMAAAAVAGSAVACCPQPMICRTGSGPSPWIALREAGPWSAICRACRDRAGRLLLGGVAAGAFAAGGLAFWLPAFLERARSVPRAIAGAQLAATVLMTGIAGAMAGRWLADRFGRLLRAPDGWAATAAALVGAGALAIAFASGPPMLYLPALMVGLLCVFAWARCAVASLTGRAGGDPAAIALAALAAFGVGDLLAAPTLGALSEGVSFGQAMMVLPAALLAAAALWGAAAWRLEAEARSAGRGPARARDVA